MADTSSFPPHFKGKDAISHVAEKQAQGKLFSSEIHGTEPPGHLSAASDAMRETALFLLICWTLLIFILPSLDLIWQVLILIALGITLWKGGRSAWLSWFRLERLHRVLKQEKWEIEHNREQERQELKELYAAKGFEGKLLDDVVAVLMADGDRLLRIMIEEELGLSLENQDHPLKQGLGAFIGALIASVCCLALSLFFAGWGLPIAAFSMIGVGGALSAYYEGNRQIPAIVWNLSLATLVFGSVYFLATYLFTEWR